MQRNQSGLPGKQMLQRHRQGHDIHGLAITGHDQHRRDPIGIHDSSGKLTGRLVYKQGGTNMPGLVLYGGPWGDGGGAAEREYAKVYAAKGMVVFLPDYFPEVCGDTNQTTLSVCLGKYFGGFLLDTPYARGLPCLPTRH